MPDTRFQILKVWRLGCETALFTLSRSNRYHRLLYPWKRTWRSIPTWRTCCSSRSNQHACNKNHRIVQHWYAGNSIPQQRRRRWVWLMRRSCCWLMCQSSRCRVSWMHGTTLKPPYLGLNWRLNWDPWRTWRGYDNLYCMVIIESGSGVRHVPTNHVGAVAQLRYETCWQDRVTAKIHPGTNEVLELAEQFRQQQEETVLRGEEADLLEREPEEGADEWQLRCAVGANERVEFVEAAPAHGEHVGEESIDSRDKVWLLHTEGLAVSDGVDTGVHLVVEGGGVRTDGDKYQGWESRGAVNRGTDVGSGS